MKFELNNEVEKLIRPHNIAIMDILLDAYPLQCHVISDLGIFKEPKTLRLKGIPSDFDHEYFHAVIEGDHSGNTYKFCPWMHAHERLSTAHLKRS